MHPRVPLTLLAWLAVLAAARAELPAKVAESEQKRIAVIEKARPAVVAIFSPGGQGGGSGVLISADGYALTNFHVVAGAGPVMKCGLANGVLYDAVLVGTDRVGDVALVKLLPQKEGDQFPFAVMGDSDKVKAGDWSLAMGNPFLLATDFTPTVTFGIVSGVHRYQYPEGGGLLEYTDCIQIEASINPGNSGGPLFNMNAELIGINGRGSFEKRGRVNSGVGYAISINQIKNFLGHLRAGLDVDHASLGAVVETEADDDNSSGRMLVRSILEDSDAFRRGLDIDHELVSFAGRSPSSVNQFKNVLGIYPKGWRVPVVHRFQDDKGKIEKKEVLVRLMGVIRKEIGGPDEEKPEEPKPPAPRLPMPRPGGQPRPGTPPSPPTDSPAAKLFVEKDGFANYYFNKRERDRLLSAFRKHADLTGLGANWLLATEDEVKQKKRPGFLSVTEEKDAAGKGTRPVVRMKIEGVERDLEPLKTGLPVERLKDPRGSGGLLTALFHFHQLMTVGEKAFPGDFSHGGIEPIYPPPADGVQKSFADRRQDCEVLRTALAGVTGKWYFSPKDQTLQAFEVWVESSDDPCEVYVSDYRRVDGRSLPHRFEVWHGDQRYGTLTVKNWKFTAEK